MKKKVIHFRIPIRDVKVIDSLALSMETVNNFLTIISKKIKNDYDIIFSPFYCTFEDNGIGENVDLDALSVKKFLEKYKIEVNK